MKEECLGLGALLLYCLPLEGWYQISQGNHIARLQSSFAPGKTFQTNTYSVKLIFKVIFIKKELLSQR